MEYLVILRVLVIFGHVDACNVCLRGLLSFSFSIRIAGILGTGQHKAHAIDQALHFIILIELNFPRKLLVYEVVVLVGPSTRCMDCHLWDVLQKIVIFYKIYEFQKLVGFEAFQENFVAIF